MDHDRLDAADGAPVSIGRRRVTQALALGAAGLALADLPALAAVNVEQRARTTRTFTAFCDAIVPADALTPAASALGVPTTILAEVNGSALAERLLAAGCGWLDAACDGDFARAGEAEQFGALERMAALPWESPPGRFFAVMRNTVMTDYYAQPATWRGLALDRPPQPLGFYDAVR